MVEDIEVSVVIPAYNCAEYITDAVNSAFIQDVPLKIIVVDDCSRDNIHAVMHGYSSGPRVRYIKNIINMGVAKSINRGIEETKGECIAFLDTHDI